MAAHPEIEASSLLRRGAPEDAERRFELAVEALARLVVETEAEQRTMLRLSLRFDAGDREQRLLRQGRAIGWLQDALAPIGGALPIAGPGRATRTPTT